ncbi:helix-turn-helix domain-containing protein [Nocardia sp. NPDC050710]|uniref:TetR/AcrR family transcriptional regulator n=1 Tax=Nocardia sp. NPDC050710 TaxID=3157220 RepID=UPI0033F744D1
MNTSERVGRHKHRRPRDRRASILRAAGEAFAEHGYHGTSMADIAGAVGISATALYRHFRNKQQLLGQCLLTGLDTTLERLDQARRVDGSGAAVLTELVRISLELRGLPRLWQLEFRNLAPLDRTAALLRVVRLTGYLRAAIRVRRPQLPTWDVELLSWCALSVAVSPSYHRVSLARQDFVAMLDAAIESLITAEVGVGERSTGRTPPRPVAPADDEFDRAVRPERMIVAAARLFNARGYAAVGIEDIGAAVGVSGPAVYHHFTSKADLLNEIIDRNAQWIRLYTSRAITESSGPQESLLLLLRYFAQFAAEEPDLVGTTVNEVGHLPADLSSRYRRAHREGILRWARMLQTVRPELSIDVARVLIQAITIVVIDAVRNPRVSHRADLVTALVAIGDRIASARPPGQ